MSALNGSNGFRLDGETAYDYSGLSVSSAGDVNGDGFDDLLIGAEQASPGGIGDAGASYVVFGKASGFTASLALSSLDGSTGFRLTGAAQRDYSGSSVASAGDVNGDGFDDLIIGARYADPIGNASYVGASYVVFGTENGFAANVALSSLDGSNGFRLVGEFEYSGSGASVASAGDVNGDGFDDVIIGAYRSDPNGNIDSGASYVVFGKATGFGADFDLATLDGSNGFRIDGVAVGDYSGWSVASAGDFNGDGYDDLIIGADRADPNGTESGAAYLVFGKAAGFAAHLQLSTLDDTAGLTLLGGATSDYAGVSVSSAGDINGDGYDDLFVGADRADPNGPETGASYVVFGYDPTGAAVTKGTAGADMLVGGSGDDTLKGRGGHDSFHGGAGNDRIVIGDLGFLLVDGGTGTDTLAPGTMDQSLDLTIWPPFSRVEGIERIDLSGFGHNTLTLDTRVVLDGLGAVSAGLHVLTVQGSSADTVQFVEGGWGKTGSFTTAEGTFDRYVLGNAEVDIRRSVLVPGATIVGTSGDDVINQSNTVPGQFFPTNRDDVIKGLGGNDSLSGLRGDDMIRGGGGNDVLNGGAGNDILDGGAGGDTLKGGGGSDTASYAHAAAGVTASLTNPAINTGEAAGDSYSSIENLTGSKYADILTGSGGANVLDGGKGDDQLKGKGGDDVLNGGGGLDTLTGGSGADTFVFDHTLAAGNLATITDFAHVDDTIALSLAIFTAAGASGTLDPNAFFAGSTAHDADDRILYDSVAGKLLYDADGSGAGAAKTFAMVGAGLPIAADNFKLF